MSVGSDTTCGRSDMRRSSLMPPAATLWSLLSGRHAYFAIGCCGRLTRAQTTCTPLSPRAVARKPSCETSKLMRPDGCASATAGRTVTETYIVNFAGITGDWNEIHTNKESAERGMFKQRIAHGALIFSIATGLSVRLGQTADTVLAFYGLDRLRFVKPTFIGDTVHVRQKVESKSERDQSEIGRQIPGIQCVKGPAYPAGANDLREAYIRRLPRDADR